MNFENQSLFVTQRIGDGQLPASSDPLAKNPNSKHANKRLIARRAKEKARRKVNQARRHNMGK